MPTYKYEAMDTAGSPVKDSIEAATEEEAQQKIRQLGYFVTKLTEVAGGKKGKKKGKKKKGFSLFRSERAIRVRTRCLKTSAWFPA